MANPRNEIQTITFASTAISGGLVSCEPRSGTSVETTAISAFGDPSETTLPASPVKYGDVTMTILDENQGQPCVAGTVDEVTLTSTYFDGTTTSEGVYSRLFVISNVAPSSIEVNGNHVSTWAITMHPVGGDNPATADGEDPSSNDSNL